jgi:hypothetical protein
MVLVGSFLKDEGIVQRDHEYIFDQWSTVEVYESA